MSAIHKNIVLLDGLQDSEQHLAPILTVLTAELKNRGEVQSFSLREMKLGHCTGCFGCWLKTPGVCVQKDAGPQIAKAIMQSDTVVFFSRVFFGGYSPELKQVVDRFFSPLQQPFFAIAHGETHHVPRYAHYPRLIGVGVQWKSDPEEASLFKLLIGRNALNLHSPSYAAEVVVVQENLASLRPQFRGLLDRSDAPPLRNSLAPHLGACSPTAADLPVDFNRKALMLIASPKVNGHSTSAALAAELSGRLESHGWETESLVLKAELRRKDGQAEFLSAVGQAGLIVLASPLYNDSLPVLAIRALEAIASQRREQPNPCAQRLAVLLNNGFTEAHQNLPALALCRQFAIQAKMTWVGGLILGGGEGVCGGQALAGKSGLPPVSHLIRALDLAGAALAEGQPIPARSVRMFAQTPISLAPFPVWRWIYTRVADGRWVKRAAANDVRKEQMLARPLEG